MSRRLRRSASKPPPTPSREPATEDALLAALAERDEAVARQAALTEVLEIVNDSQGDLAAVFDAIVERAIRLCGADFGGIWMLDGDRVRAVGGRNLPERYLDYLTRQPPSPSQVFGRAVRERPFLHIPDLAETDAYRNGLPLTVVSVELGGIRTFLGVPLREGGSVVGLINLYRKEVRLFADNQIKLVQAFAAQALIAMKNARLFNETKEALERQTATAEILKVIAGSPGDVKPVFDAIATSANRLINGFSTAVFRIFGDAVHLAAFTPTNAEADEALKARFPMPRARFHGFELVRDGASAEVADTELGDGLRDLARLRGWRSALFTPLMSNAAPIGVISVTRKERGAFAEHHIQLLRTFADQAVIAIENARLFNETQEALQRQTATADILRVIASSPSDLQPVLDRLAETACRLCGAYDGVVLLREGDQLRVSAHYGPIPVTFATQQIDPGWLPGRAVIERRAIHLDDIAKYADEYPVAAALASASGAAGMQWRATAAMPLMREGEAVGVIGIRRAEAAPFSAGQIALLQTFADQAVIAIQNARLFDEVQARTRDLSEALEQQTASAEILRVISSSPTDARPVFETIVRTARKLCGAERASIHMLRDGLYHMAVAVDGRPAAQHDDSVAAHPISPGRGSITGRVALERRVVHVLDVKSDPEFTYLLQDGFEFRRTMLGVPLLRDGEAIGVIVLQRSVVKPFAQRHIDLVTTFADQAVIAIENVHLFEEVQARTRDLEEALAQQTATANVLKVISRSAFDLDAVLKTLTDSARSLSGAATAAVFLRNGEVVPLRAASGVPAEFLEFMNAHPARPGKDTLIGRVAMTGEAVHIPDVLADPDYSYGVGPQIGDYRALFGAPLIRDGKVDGVFGLMHPTPGAFLPRQMEMVRAFADQAVIAIENARLFEEVQAKTRDIEESLQQQTATADVLKVISRSTFDLQPVLDTLVESASRLCDTEMAFILRRDGEVFRAGAQVGYSREYMEYLQSHPLTVDRGSITGRVALERRVVQILDCTTDLEYTLAQTTSLTGQRTALGVPLIREGEVIGVIVLARQRVEAFTERQIELVKTFADQAVIAISNVGLFNETREALQRQTATADVLKVISRSAFDLQAVLHTLVESAAKLCEADAAVITREVDGVLYRAESYGCSDEFMAAIRRLPVVPDRGTVSGRVLLEGKAIQIGDIEADPEYALKAQAKIDEFRTGLGIPMLRDGAAIGVITLMRTAVHAFSDKQIELVQTFADQAVIAIENARLFDEVQARTHDLQEALQQQTATADVLKVISRSAFDLETVTTTILKSAMELCRAPTGLLHLRDGDVFRMKLSLGHKPELDEFNRQNPIQLRDALHARRPVRLGDYGHYSDMWNDPEYRFKYAVKLGDVRAGVVMPMFREGEVIGLFSLARREPGPFTPSQIKLVQTFADQAAIAIENVRLFNEVKIKTDDLSEALQQQTATAEVLKVISRSAFDLQTVLDTLVRSAKELCDAASGVIYLQEGEAFHLKAESGLSQDLVRYLRQNPQKPGRGSGGGRVLLTGEVQNIADIQSDQDYDPDLKATATHSRALLGVPLMRNQGIFGAIVLTRPQPGFFSERQIEVVQTFADQAVIAVENMRLFDEVQARTRELAASLENLHKAQDRLVQSEKLASLGQLTAGIAHEIKNPLNFVNNFSALSQELIHELAGVIKAAPFESAQREEAEELIETIGGNLEKVVQHGRRADSIVKNMLLHAREGSGERSSVSVNAMVDESLNLAYHGARAEKPGFNVTIEKSLDPDAGAAILFPQEMTRVLLNLISNAFYATNKRKQAEWDSAYEPTIAASTRDLGHSVEIAIRDNGTGISDDVKAKMFNPFFTTKPAGEGTGLGLSLSHDIVVKQHGGTLDVSSEPGAFTKFTIVLPRAAAEAS